MSDEQAKIEEIIKQAKTLGIRVDTEPKELTKCLKLAKSLAKNGISVEVFCKGRLYYFRAEN